MKKWITILASAVCILLYFTTFSVTATAASLTKVTFNDVVARKGETVEIVVSISDCQAFKSMAVVPLYDSERLEYISGEWLIDGALLSDWSQEEQNGVILYSSETIINGEIAKFVFKVADDSSWDDIDFSCKVVLKNGNSEIDVDVAPLKIFILCDHVWDSEMHTVDSTCAQEGYIYRNCTICNREDVITVIEKAAHTESDWMIDRVATLHETGSRHKECLVCREILEQETIPLLGQCNHIWGEEVFVDKATIVKSGMVYKNCQICGEKLKLYDLDVQGVKLIFVILASIGSAIVAGVAIWIICTRTFLRRKKNG